MKFSLDYSPYCKQWIAYYKKDNRFSYWGQGRNKKEALVNLCITIKKLG